MDQIGKVAAQELIEMANRKELYGYSLFRDYTNHRVNITNADVAIVVSRCKAICDLSSNKGELTSYLRKMKFGLSFDFDSDEAKLMPIIDNYEEYPFALGCFVLLYKANTKQYWHERIMRCNFCAKYFLLHTIKSSKFCSYECRYKSSNQNRLTRR